VALPGQQFYYWPSREVGIAFKHHAYKFFNLPIPNSPPKTITVMFSFSFY